MTSLGTLCSKRRIHTLKEGYNRITKINIEENMTQDSCNVSFHEKVMRTLNL